MSTKADKVDHGAETMRATAEAICAMIEQGMGDPKAWAKSWRTLSYALGGAVNATTHRPYTGGNAWHLATLEMMGTRVGPWATYKQWASIGATVQKGAKATWILVPKTVKRDTTEAERERWGEGAPDKVSRTFFGAAPLFAANQVDGYQAVEQPERTPGDTIPAENWTMQVVDVGRVNLIAGEPAARPAAGIVYMPPAEAFDSLDAYLCTFWHELTHWTAPKVQREMTAKRFGDQAYAAEELVAELGAAVIAARHGLSAEPRPDHLHYLAHWHQILKSDPSKLWTAAKQAEKAAGYLFDLVPQPATVATPTGQESEDSLAGLVPLVEQADAEMAVAA